MKGKKRAEKGKNGTFEGGLEFLLVEADEYDSCDDYS